MGTWIEVWWLLTQPGVQDLVLSAAVGLAAFIGVLVWGDW
jgi:hypothetical protein